MDNTIKESFHSIITADGSSGFKAEVDRYHLYISLACPWACRTLIVRKLKKLENVISLSIVDPVMGDEGWHFSENAGCISDFVNHKKYLSEIYEMAQPNFSGRVSVPVLWDKKTKTIVNNESPEIIRMFNSEFNAFTDSKIDLYPVAFRTEINAINQRVFENINLGVYKAGFANTQEEYETAFHALFAELDRVEKLLSQKRYLTGNQITEADWRLFTTLIRFDAVYYVHFKCNLHRIIDYPNIGNYVRELYQYPGIKETVNFDHIKRHYYLSHTDINPKGIVPLGPELKFDEPHNRGNR
ncbi:MAG: glutathione S-transferase family protein [Coxiellaceae bacterium]|nr:glutathione S-transferase family protein [Coxiellaceae bacterium]